MANLNFDTVQFTLAAEGVAQKIGKLAVRPGEANPLVASVTIRAMKSNTGIIYIAGTEANATSSKGFELAAGDALSIDVTAAVNIWINGTKTGDKICVAWVGP